MKLDLEKIRKRHHDLQQQVCDPNFIADIKRSKPVLRELRHLTQILNTADQIESFQKTLLSCEEILEHEKDPDLLTLAQDEKQEIEKKLTQLKNHLELLLLPPDPHEGKTIFIELRAGAGGDEAALFVMDLASVYEKFAGLKGLKFEVIESTPGPVGGYREWIAQIKGESAYHLFQFESGVHRVQRVPETETQGRVHTSTITVAILPEAEDYDVEIKESDLRIDTFRSSGAGGQHVNKTDSAVRITHLPTNIVVTCQDGRSQIKNKEQAMKILKAKLLQKYEEEALSKEREARRSQVGRGDRSERIRTYNYPQKRITDHRIQQSYFNFQDIMNNGNLEEIVHDLWQHRKIALLDQQLKGSPPSHES